MAEWVVEFVLKNLADFIVKEAQLLGGVGKKVERVQCELIRIQCCLKDAADSKHEGDERVQNWLNELRDVAYRIADATDSFFLPEVEDHHKKEASSFLQKLKKLGKKPMKLTNLHKLGTELDNIQKLLQEIYESRLHYGIKDLPLEDKSKGQAVRMPLRRATYSEVDENEVVGLQIDKNNILELLHLEKTPRRAVITIVGAGGLGKTTLACMVYKSAQKNFNYHIMLSISQQFSLTDLLIRMISKYNDSVLKDKDVDYYVGQLREFLSSRRYLIILDDVWTGDLWNELKEVLPDNKNGSRVLMTTRLNDVAKSADSKIPPYELNLLNQRESLDLLLKKAFPYQEPNEECPKDLLELAPELSKKCKGLPLALIVLGGILATKVLSYPAWERVLQTMNWHLDGSGCMQILAMSYEEMPYYLKACFQYLACFPEDYVISAKRLISMWIVEGFIPLNGRQTIEIMAEECLEELSKRSMIQVQSRYVNGLIKHFQVHDILRDLAMNKAGHEKFVTVFSQLSDDTRPENIIRRASLQAKERNPHFVEYIGPNTRSLMVFGFSNFKMKLRCSHFRLLKVLEIVGSSNNHLYKLKSLDELIHLKYLGLRDCWIFHYSCSFRGLKSLETLDMRGCKGTPPSDDFWSIGTLMHVRDNMKESFLNSPLPKGIDLSNLQTLKWVTLEKRCDVKLSNVRKLGIKYDFYKWVYITNILQTLPFLVSLGIKSDCELIVEIIYPKALPNYQNLQSLYLDGVWPKNVNLEASSFPPHLVKLSLVWSLFRKNPMPELGKLNSLKKLCLGFEVWSGPIICPEGFPALQYLRVGTPQLQCLTVAQGVMPKLTYLKVFSSIEVNLPSELQHVTVERW